MKQISATDPIFHAIEQMKKVLFQPFDIAKWFVLGFCAWLAYLGQGVGSGGPHFHWGRGPNIETTLVTMQNWLSAHWFLAGFLFMGTLGFGLLLSLVLLWLQSRGHFLFIDGIVHNRAQVVAPWKEYSLDGNRLFIARAILVLIVTAMMGMLILIFGGIVWSDLAADQHLGKTSILAILMLIGSGAPIALVFFILKLLIHDFVVPVMYARRTPFLESAGLVWQEVIQPWFGSFLLFYLFRILLGILLGLITAALLFATCCIVLIPYIGTVILLPLLVFSRSYSLFYVDQFEPKFKIFPRPQDTDEMLPRDPRFLGPEQELD